MSEKYVDALQEEAANESLRNSEMQEAVRSLELRGADEAALGMIHGARAVSNLVGAVDAAVLVQHVLRNPSDRTESASEAASEAPSRVETTTAIADARATLSIRPSCASEARRRLQTCDLSLGCMWRSVNRACLSAPSIVPTALKPALVALVGSLPFELLTLGLVFANAVLLSFDKAGASQARTKTLTDGNYALCFFFIVEICLRWAAAGFRFWADGFNTAEAVLAIVSLVDAGAQFTGADSRQPLLFVLHSTRSLRILRIARFYKGWLRVLETIAKAVPPATSALALLIVFLLTASVVGMQVCKS